MGSSGNYSSTGRLHQAKSLPGRGRAGFPAPGSRWLQSGGACPPGKGWLVSSRLTRWIWTRSRKACVRRRFLDAEPGLSRLYKRQIGQGFLIEFGQLERDNDGNHQSHGDPGDPRQFAFGVFLASRDLHRRHRRARLHLALTWTCAPRQGRWTFRERAVSPVAGGRSPAPGHSSNRESRALPIFCIFRNGICHHPGPAGLHSPGERCGRLYSVYTPSAFSAVRGFLGPFFFQKAVTIQLLPEFGPDGQFPCFQTLQGKVVICYQPGL